MLGGRHRGASGTGAGSHAASARRPHGSAAAQRSAVHLRAYSRHMSADYSENRCGAHVVRLSDVKAERVTWLWQDRIPLGKLTVIEGNPGTGKSTLTTELAACVTTGSQLPGGP